MWSLYRRYYASTSRKLFERDFAQKDSLLVLRDADDCIRGFSTIAVGLTQFDGCGVRYVFSGDTIIEPAYWGTQALAFSWLRHAGEIKRMQPEVPLFWFLIVKGHRTFRYLPAFAREFFPHWKRHTPVHLAALMNKLAHERFGAAFDAASGVVRYQESQGHLAGDIAEASEREAGRDDVSFFFRRNSGYRNGDELVCLCELSAENLRPLARRLFENTH